MALLMAGLVQSDWMQSKWLSKSTNWSKSLFSTSFLTVLNATASPIKELHKKRVNISHQLSSLVLKPFSLPVSQFVVKWMAWE